MIDINRPVRTRDGREVIGLSSSAIGLRGYIVDNDNLCLTTWQSSGWWHLRSFSHRYDLINIDPPAWPQL